VDRESTNPQISIFFKGLKLLNSDNGKR